MGEAPSPHVDYLIKLHFVNCIFAIILIRICGDGENVDGKRKSRGTAFI
jgi:hypothetical protein